MSEASLGTHELAFAFSGIYLGLLLRFLLIDLLTSFSTIPFLLLIMIFVLISTIVLKKGSLGTYRIIYFVFRSICFGDRKRIRKYPLTEYDFNILVPSVTTSLIVADLFSYFRSLVKDNLLVLLLTLITSFVVFWASYKISHKGLPLI